MGKKNLYTKKHLFIILSVIFNVSLLVFIFSRSLTPAELSAEESGTVMDLINSIFPLELSDHAVRKLAHFTEFCALGIITTLTVHSFCKRPFNGIFAKLFLCLAAAVTDEALQINTVGRSAEVNDVILDFFGSFIGILLTTLIILLIRIRYKKVE